ncbi:hypothetical protein [Sphingomonas sp.]|uniref:hypothetical protein n=1 Tax=Sphingomonas sp. TaxID=28214 RepID=UPI003CC5E328
MKPLLAGLAAFLVSSAGLALAQDMPQMAPPAAASPRMPGGMMRADTDGDGAISRAEYLAAAGVRFDRMDANHDGKLTPDELGARMGGGRRGGGEMPPPPAPPRPQQ